MTATIRKRRKDEASVSNSICTPKWLNDRLGRFDIDPCSNDRSTVNADWTYSLEKRLDGLRLPWHGRAFVNWPFGDPLPFAEKAITELSEGRCTELVVLCKDDGSTEWWHTITQPILFDGVPFSLHPEMWRFNERLEYDEPPELVAMREQKRADAIAKIYNAVRKCPRDSCFGQMGVGAICNTRNGTPHLERMQAAGYKSIPSATTSNNFCSVILHHRGLAPKLNLEDVATRWVRPVEAIEQLAKLDLSPLAADEPAIEFVRRSIGLA